MSRLTSCVRSVTSGDSALRKVETHFWARLVLDTCPEEVQTNLSLSQTGHQQQTTIPLSSCLVNQ